MVKTTADVKNLEKELTPFLNNEEKSCFNITPEFSWVIDATEQIERMIEENSIDPEALLQEYKKFEFVSNVSIKGLEKELFANEELIKDGKKGKVPLEQIAAAVQKFSEAEEAILNCSNDTVDFTIFRVEATETKNSLSK